MAATAAAASLYRLDRFSILGYIGDSCTELSTLSARDLFRLAANVAPHKLRGGPKRRKRSRVLVFRRSSPRAYLQRPCEIFISPPHGRIYFANGRTPPKRPNYYLIIPKTKYNLSTRSRNEYLRRNVNKKNCLARAVGSCVRRIIIIIIIRLRYRFIIIIDTLISTVSGVQSVPTKIRK